MSNEILAERSSQKSVFIHIGMNKTGSSAIQSDLFSNRHLLEENGLLYPTFGAAGAAHYGLSDFLGFSQKPNRKLDSNEFEKKRNAFDVEFNASCCQSAVFSSEFFVLWGQPEDVAKFFNDYKVTIIVYLRRHDNWWVSAYNQALKTVATPPWGLGIESYLNFHKGRKSQVFNHRTLLNRWADVFGKENLIVRPHEEGQNLPNITSDFLSAIGHSAISEKLSVEKKRLNVSLPYGSMELMDIFQRLDVSDSLRSLLVTYTFSLPPDETKTEVLSPEMRLELINENIEDYKFIAREFLGRSDGVLFYEQLPSAEPSWVGPKPIDRVDLVQHVLKALKKR
ncbi:hypothetical protein ACFFUT_14425 [Pseudohalocynthiibacter aestuariivivens]|uniref:Sulfotransferase family protein n=1 Tax=Pseudohalocynthiibacter aestuariivivens TaxID=1591409 RepID=A0ABV5JHQ2_9RHOB|nr:hypothetical protein [Pseudohalocynthiibacter aestuariivivens]MBS9715316.1 hypothetical protein [Pseudohalocynthiibacter aestuariivivens]